MSVLIKDMEMPKNCASCFVEESECKALADAEHLYIWRDRAPNCPLVEIPTPHGRLIDADAFDERVRVAGGMSEEELTEDFKDGVQTVLYMLSKQPAIIEAEGSDT